MFQSQSACGPSFSNPPLGYGHGGGGLFGSSASPPPPSNSSISYYDVDSVTSSRSRHSATFLPGGLLSAPSMTMDSGLGLSGLSTGPSLSAPSPASSSSLLTQLITLQQAEGYWKMDEPIAVIIGSSVADLKTKCPVECSSSVELLWATMLALVKLETKYAGQKDEWELVAMKAEMWLQAQPLPPKSSLDSFKMAAKACTCM